MGGEQNLGTLGDKVLDGRDGATDACIISNGTSGQRHVQVTTDQHTLAPQLPFTIRSCMDKRGNIIHGCIYCIMLDIIQVHPVVASHRT